MGDPICTSTSVDGPPQSHTSDQTLSTTNITIISSEPIVFDLPVRKELPSELYQQGMTFENCSASSMPTGSDTLQVSFTRTSSIAIAKSITHTNAASMNFSFKPVEAVSVGGSITVTNSATSGTTDTSTYTVTVTRSQGVSEQLKPMSASVAILRTWPVKYTSPFHTVATVDGDLSQNDKGYHRLSDIFAPSQRTFPITGTIDFTDAADAELITYDIPLDKSKCPANKANIAKAPLSIATLAKAPKEARVKVIP
jgi:hypothetical protein